MTFLLDVNLLLALSDPMHIHHEPAHRWFAQSGQEAWATCPITENAYVRIASNPNYPNRPGEVAVVLDLLNRFCAGQGHEFWPADIRLGDYLLPGAVVTHKQLTDVYLLSLAVHHGGKLATLDQRIPVSTIRGGGESLELIGS
jgi:toxin-antitoxin system PIN domain toxin